MRLEEPAWWYGKDERRRRVVGFAGNVVGRLATRRMRQKPRWRAPVPVICIGNFTAGGTGKTPLSLLVAEMLSSLGERPAFLTRGYGGHRRTQRMVDRALDTAEEVGDEAVMLAAHAPTCVSRDRVAGARLITALERRPTVIIMDDGLQNPNLYKDLTIAVVDGGRGIGNGLVVPAGPLRAPLEAQLDLASAVVVNGQEHDGDRVSSWLRARFKGPVLAARAEPRAPLVWLREQNWIAFAGIGNPQRFFDMLRANGAEVIHTISYPDHHPFSERDANELLDTANSVQAGLVTTEKDRARLVGRSGRRGELVEQLRTLPINMKLSDADRARLMSLLQGVLARQGKLAT